jgi:hypothetical protein
MNVEPPAKTDGRAVTPRREVYCGDAIAWMQTHTRFEGANVITSLPDVSEVPPHDLPRWQRWFTDAAQMIIERVPDDAVAIFFQSDIKYEGVWIDKGYLVHKAAENVGAALLWHKIACRKPAGTVVFGRAGYSHLLCYSRALRPPLSNSTADVLADVGAMTWSKAMGVKACALAVRFVLRETRHRTVIDPFCGYGTVLAAANAVGLDAVGVELSKRKCRRAEALKVEL